MEKLFGLPMANLALGLATVVALIALVLAFLGWRNRLVFTMAVRNIPRRPAQTVLIIAGLTLSTTIIAAALAIGDTVTNSIRNAVYEGLGGTDVRVASPAISAFGDDYLPYSRVDDVRKAVAGDIRVDGVLPEIRQILAVTLSRTGKTDARARAVGFERTSLMGFEGAKTASGAEIDLTALGPAETVLNIDLARKLDARTGDVIEIVTPSGRTQFIVKAIAQHRGLAGSDPSFPPLLMPLESLQDALGRDGQVNVIEISTAGGQRENVRLSKEVGDDLRLKFTDSAAAAEIFQALKDPAIIAAIEKQAAPESSLPTGLKKNLGVLAEELKKPALTDEFKTQIAKSTVAGAVLVAVEQAGRSDLSRTLFPAVAKLQVLEVDGIKDRLVDLAELIGNFVTTFFTIFGSFSIIVGLLLIFLVFVLLAASRTSEMGIARAVGMKRAHLVQMFMFEGFIYAVTSALAGVALGVLASVVLVQLLVGALGPDEGFTIHYSLHPRSLVVAFSTGLLITAVTVGFSAYRVSKLNIVVAIRGLAQELVSKDRAAVSRLLRDIGIALIAPAYHLASLAGAVLNRRTVGGSLWRFLATLLVLSWAYWIVAAITPLIFRFAGQGWPVLVAGILIARLGINAEQASLFATGVSIMLIGAALLLRLLLELTRMRQDTEDRIAYTFLGVTMLIFWALPFDALEGLTGKLKANIEMFILSGVWMVAAATWVVAFNADLLLWVMDRTLGRLGRLRPVLKMAVAYPLASKFRTGLTLAMFALVIFTLIVFAILNNLGNIARDEPDRVTGGYDIRASVAWDSPVPDIRKAVADSSLLDADDFEVIASQTTFPTEARQPGAKEQRFKALGVRVVDAEFLKSNKLQITHYDPAYGTVSREVWEALAGDPSLAVVSAAAVVTAEQGGFGDFGSGFKAEGVKSTEPGPMTAFTVEMRPPLGQTGAAGTVTRKVIGVVDAFGESLDDSGGGGPGGGGTLLYSGPDMRTAFNATPLPWRDYKFRLKDPSRAADIAPKLETVFLTNSMEASSTKKDIEDSLQQNQAFNRLFGGFMSLGLVVGVAALGVISFRAVVERRQSIGMLRALGFRSGMVRLQFLIESSFVALLGTAMGIALGTLISWNIVNSIGDEVEGLQFTIPWLQVALIVTVALVFSLLMSWAPARQASKIYPSEALRYE